MPLLALLLTLAQAPAPPSASAPPSGWAALAETLGASPAEARPTPRWPPEGQETYTLSGLPGRQPLEFQVTALAEGAELRFVPRAEGLGRSKEPAVSARYEGRWWLAGPDPELLHAVAVLLGASEDGPLYAVDLRELSVTYVETQEGWTWGDQGLLRVQQSWTLDDQVFINKCSCPLSSTAGAVSWERVLGEDGWPVFAQERRALTYTQHPGGMVRERSVSQDEGALTWRRRG